MKYLSLFDYESRFKSICEGLGRDFNEKIVFKCYQKTKHNMKIEQLDVITILLEESSRYHPTYSDFIKAAISIGYRRYESVKSSYEPCVYEQCNGDGYLTVIYPDESEIMYKCQCGQGRENKEDVCHRERGGRYIVPTWNPSLKESHGYILKTNNSVIKDSKAKEEYYFIKELLFKNSPYLSKEEKSIMFEYAKNAPDNTDITNEEEMFMYIASKYKS